MSGISRTTTDHTTIQRWTEARGGSPARVKGTGKDGVGVIRLHFSDDDAQSLEGITWNDFFEKFEENKLALAYQETTRDGRVSRFNRIVSRQGA